MSAARPLALVALVFLPALVLADVPAPAWQQWRHVPGVFDVSGPRSDGRLVAATSGRMLLVDPAGGAASPFAGGPGGYADDPGTEAYLAVSPGLHVAGAGCDFARDDVFVLRLHQPLGVTRVTAAGSAEPFAAVPGVDSLNGITFDTTGRFGGRLLVTGPAHGRTTVVAIDCRGNGQVVTDSAPVLEGGLAVAPAGFGPFGGALVAPDELSGRIYAIDADGGVRTIAESGLPTGGDIGVESAGFVPAGFGRGGGAYYADRATTGNPHPGTDSLLRLDAGVLTRAGARDGDLLVATEGGAALIGVHCAASCQVTQVVATPTTAHGEGHIALVAGPAPAGRAAASAGAGPPALAIGLAALAVLLLVVAATALALRRR
jgi:hypothetical protein